MRQPQRRRAASPGVPLDVLRLRPVVVEAFRGRQGEALLALGHAGGEGPLPRCRLHGWDAWGWGKGASAGGAANVAASVLCAALDLTPELVEHAARRGFRSIGPSQVRATAEVLRLHQLYRRRFVDRWPWAGETVLLDGVREWLVREVER